MLFRRREDPTFSERVRVALWPRRSWTRSTQYIKHRVWRLRGSPHAIALGFAAGVMVSFTPFIGFHFIAGGLLALVLGGSVIASAFGTFVGNPLTFPFIWYGIYKLGNLLLGTEGEFNPDILVSGFEKLWVGISDFSGDVLLGAFDILWPLLKPMTVGGVLMGILAGMLFYLPVLKAVKSYQRRRSQFVLVELEEVSGLDADELVDSND